MELPGPRVAANCGRTAHRTHPGPEAVPTSFRLHIDGPGPGAWNMALDEALMGAACAGAATLRFYAWDPGCLSVGRNQATPERVQGRPRDELRIGEDVVRRPTGGRSVYHDRELTYSLTVPDRAWGGPRRVYRRINRALRDGLASLGAAVDADPVLQRDPGFAETRAGSGPLGPRPCFQAPAPGEVTAAGRKLVGSAQWRHAGALLQHGSVLLWNEQKRGDLAALIGGSGSSAEAAAIGLSELLPELPEPDRLIRALADAFTEQFALRPEPAAPDPAIAAEARRLAAQKYRTPEWTWRR